MSIVTLSPIPNPWGVDVSISATLWLTSNGLSPSLREVSVTTFVPEVLNKLLDCKK